MTPGCASLGVLFLGGGSHSKDRVPISKDRSLLGPLYLETTICGEGLEMDPEGLIEDSIGSQSAILRIILFGCGSGYDS